MSVATETPTVASDPEATYRETVLAGEVPGSELCLASCRPVSYARTDADTWKKRNRAVQEIELHEADRAEIERLRMLETLQPDQIQVNELNLAELISMIEQHQRKTDPTYVSAIKVQRQALEAKHDVSHAKQVLINTSSWDLREKMAQLHDQRTKHRKAIVELRSDLVITQRVARLETQIEMVSKGERLPKNMREDWMKKEDPKKTLQRLGGTLRELKSDGRRKRLEAKITESEREIARLDKRLEANLEEMCDPRNMAWADEERTPLTARERALGYGQ